jgi:hypothetical protein
VALPRAAAEYEAEQAHILTVALRGVRRAWRRMAGRNWESAWRTDVGPNARAVILTAQEAASASADAYVAAVLAELDIPSDVPTSLNIDALVGVAGDGRPVDSLSYGGVIATAKAQYAPDVESLSATQAAQRALASGQDWMDQMVATLLADTARSAEVASTAQRTWVHGYVRMVEPGACARCVILAGKFYRYNDGFLRHPRCRCTHIPSTEDAAGDLRTNPNAYFDGLPRAQQDETFTPAGAEAIRMGADVNQVVNSRRGMQVAQVYGRRTLITTEATTARGLAGKSLGDLAKTAGQRYRVSQTPRLMPETILAHASSPQDALRLLKRFGYVL